MHAIDFQSPEIRLSSVEEKDDTNTMFQWDDGARLRGSQSKARLIENEIYGSLSVAERYAIAFNGAMRFCRFLRAFD